MRRNKNEETARSHVPVLLAETLEGLRVWSEGIYLDGTYGRGGHARAVLARLGPNGRLLVMDRDPEAIADAEREFGADPRVAIRHAAFAELSDWEETKSGLDGVLFDLGVSSPQLDQPSRGFSFMADGPLDMRMDPTRGESAAQWLAHATEAQIREAIEEYGEERFAKQVAAAIVAARARAPLVRTQQLAELVAAAVRTREAGQNPATRTFQALRILVNRGLEEVSLMLPQAVARLAPGGRLAVVSFHSLEDRIAKRFLRSLARPDMPRELPLRASEMPQPLLRIVGRPQRPAAREVATNPRARSAVLRVAERTAVPLDPALLSRTEPDAWRS